MLQLKHIKKAYTTADFTQVALDDVSVTFRDSEFVAILGPSGSGKTTMLNILGGLDHADSGDIVVNGVSTKDYSDKDWDTYRNHRIGFVFQSYNLIPHQTILSNVELALTLSGVGRSERRARATKALEAVGLGDHVNKRPAQLSGGQMQRVAIARALVNDPDIVLADEPTGALDTETGIQVMDILKGVASDRLVVMVTHNPELAEQYATRIVRVKDGRIVGDTNPLTDGELAGAAAPEPPAREVAPAAALTGATQPMAAAVAPPRGRGSASDRGPSRAATDAKRDAAKGKRASMGFLTALSLSFNNLMTKKGRTFMTAFAGSIGIIGIAAILALSNGVNNYIADTEEAALSSYPLTITKSSFDMTNLLSYGMARSSDAGSSSSGAKKSAKSSDAIPQESVMTDMFAQVKNNDLSSFKKYLDSGKSGIDRYVNAVEYGYGITPQVYSTNTENGITRLNPSYMSTTLSSGAMGSALTGGNTMSSFSQLVSDDDLLKSNMRLVTGKWPKKYDEAVLVLDNRGKLSDYTLYSLGFYDTNVMNQMMNEAINGQQVTAPKEKQKKFTYGDALGMTFSVVPASNLYQRNDAQNTWTDMSKDENYMRQQIASGIQLKIVGVIEPSGDSDSSLVQEGVAYTPALTKELMDRAANSQIVQEQKANPDVDVFTGKTFAELQSSQNQFDMNDMFTVDQDALKQAFSIDTSALNAQNVGQVDLSGVSLDQAGFDSSNIQLDTSALDNMLNDQTVQKIAEGAPDFTEYLANTGQTTPELTPEQQAAIQASASRQVSGYMAWRDTVPEGGDNSFKAYQQTAEAQQEEANLKTALGDETYNQIQQLYQGYLGYLGQYFEQQIAALMQQAAQTMATQLASQMSAQMTAATRSMGSQISTAISSQLQSQMASLSSSLQNGFKVDPQAFKNAIHFNMTQEDLASLLTNYMNADELTYDSNMGKLGYADRSNPESISIYPKDFPAKASVIRVIDKYNDQQKAAGNKDATIQYSDIAGTLMSSVTDIVNMISMVLIAFVSISLVVSSIMIGIITYISVLERKKEIGILRAMGASKLNVANVFNAETIIEGLIAGVFAIVVVLIAEVPVNHLVLQWKGVPNIMILPWQSALILIGISVLLTFLGGLIPSTKASKNDPVESLRSE